MSITRAARGFAAAALGGALLAVVPAGPAGAIDFDLRTWSPAGNPLSWDVNADGTQLTQSQNGEPGFFVSPETFSQATIAGTITTQPAGDDDYVGFVVGYSKSGTTSDFTVITWKAADQSGFGGCTAQEGFGLMQFTGVDDADFPDDDFRLDTFWCHEQVNDDPRAEVLDTNWADNGWRTDDYEFTIHYSPTQVRVLIDGVEVLSANGTFPAGSFGFYNYSQPQVSYSGVGTVDEPVGDGDAERLDGQNRFETSVEISRDSWAEAEADAVVLARSDVFADSLAGTPLAVDKQGPLLITPPDGLRNEIRTEIQRALGPDTSKIVYLLGGTSALSPTVAAQVAQLGYQVVRLDGLNRFETAVRVADELSQVDAILLTSGLDFPDALSAGPAAAEANGAVLLTAGPNASAATTIYLEEAAPGTPLFAIGGPAASAYSFATQLVGGNRSETASLVAVEFFTDPVIAGVARSDDFPDSLGGGAHIGTGLADLARRGGPMLLTSPTSLSQPVADYLCLESDAIERVYVYGGPAAIQSPVAAAAAARAEGTGC